MEILRYIFHTSEYIRRHLKLPPYLFAIITVLIGIIVRIILQPIVGGSSSLLVFVIPLLLAGWYGGFKPVLLSTILSVIIGYVFFTEPYFTVVSKGYDNLVRVPIFITEGILIGLISESRLRREREIEMLLEKTTREKVQREKAVQFRDEFVSIASHELKTPVTTINIMLQILNKSLLHKNSDKKVLINYVQRMNEQVDRLIVLIDDLLNVSKIQAGKLKLHKELTDLESLVAKIVEIIQIANPNHNITIKGTLRHEVFCDKDRISQVLTNLLSNAVKYSPNAHSIIVTLKEHNNHVTICVKDFGIGIHTDHQKKIFNRFFRSEGQDERVFTGFGLGLYISKEIIKLHKGKIWVESIPGKGSNFYFTLPVAHIYALKNRHKN